MSRMFTFITLTWNPLGGKCPHECVYCWANMLCKRYGHEKYMGLPRLYEKELQRRFRESDFVFVQDMSDLYADKVPTRLILKVLDVQRENPQTTFLNVTKNPSRYIRLAKDNEFPDNAILGATVETDYHRFYGKNTEGKWLEYQDVSNAPFPAYRLETMHKIYCTHPDIRRFIAIEPVLDFSTDKRLESIFIQTIKTINPWAVAVGYDNYGHHLPEPSLEKTESLIAELETFTTVYRKTIRKAWWEK